MTSSNVTIYVYYESYSHIFSWHCGINCNIRQNSFCLNCICLTVVYITYHENNSMSAAWTALTNEMVGTTHPRCVSHNINEHYTLVKRSLHNSR